LNQESDYQNLMAIKTQAKLYFVEFPLSYQCELNGIHLQGPFEHFNSVLNFTDWNSNIISHRYYIIIDDGLAFHF